MNVCYGMKRTKWTDAAGLAGAVVVVSAAAMIGAWATSDGTSGWYRRLEKPRWTPPAWVFGPVWTALYGTIAVSAWLVWLRRDRANIRPASGLFLAQLSVNALWSVLFFGLHRPFLALVDVVLLVGLIAANVRAFWRIRPLAGVMLVPYLAWTAFATALNFAIWRMNAGRAEL